MVISSAALSMSVPITWASDGAQDIGAAGANRPRTGYFTTSVQIGANPASTGQIRLPNTGSIQFRNAANNADIIALSVIATNVIQIGNAAADSVTLELANQGLRINGQTSAPGSGAGTLTNAPSAGNPHFWLPISIAGTVRKKIGRAHA